MGVTATERRPDGAPERDPSARQIAPDAVTPELAVDLAATGTAPRRLPIHAASSMVMALQRSAGNAAVRSLLTARVPAVLQRDDAPGAAPAGPAAGPAAPAPTHTILRQGDGPSVEVGELQQALNALGAATPPLRITAMFDLMTAAALISFQASNPPLVADGVCGLETWAKLDEQAPRVIRQRREVVEGPGGGEPRGAPLSGSIHPTIRRNSTGPAVEELQQKLNTIPSDQVPTMLEVDGKFGGDTRTAVVEFQRSRTPALGDDGVVGPLTWAALDAASGPVTVGRESFDWEQRAEGTITGGPARFTWRLLDDRLQVTVNIRFAGSPNHPRVAGWRTDITNVWNAFHFENQDDASHPLQLEFVVGTGLPADATVNVVVTPAGATPGRSNSANWHTGDTDPGLAPHEFGHLIGLQDEYNRAPEQYAAVTGEQGPIGTVDAPLDASGNPVAPETIAAEMRTALTGPAAGRGAAARAVVTKYSLRQGAFCQRVAQAYETANAGTLLREDFGPAGFSIVNDPAGSMGNDIAARIPGQFDAAGNEAVAVEPFLYTNRSIMGDMTSMQAPISAHNHPVAERHVRHFLEIVRQNRPGTWRTVR